jgi:hypothetical protein
MPSPPDNYDSEQANDEKETKSGEWKRRGDGQHRQDMKSYVFV